MRVLISLGVAIVVATATSVSAPAGEHVFRGTGVVLRAVNGHTLTVRLDGGAIERVSVVGLRVPPRGSCYAREAAEEIRARSAGARVVLRGDTAWSHRDTSGRLNAYVAVRGEGDLGTALLSAGAAQVDLAGAVFDRFVDYASLQRAAESLGRGMWGACSADAAVALAVKPARIEAGERLTYVATVTNDGLLSAENVRLELRPPLGARIVSLASALGACTAGTWFGTCTFRRLQPGVTATAALVVEPSAEGVVSTRARVRFPACVRTACGRAPLADLRPLNNTAAVLATVGAEIDSREGDARAGCDERYPTVCIPPPPPFLHCADIPYREFHVPRGIPDADPHALDGDQDGVGCQRDDY